MDRLAVARHQRHAVLALRHQDGFAVRQLHRVLCGVGDALFGIGAAAGRLGKLLAVGRQQRGAAIDRKVGALGIDDHALAEFFRGVDDVADHPRGQHALGIVGQQHDIRARRVAAGSRRSVSARSRRKPAAPLPSPRAACGWRNVRRRSAPCASSAATGRRPARLSIRLSCESADFSAAPASSSPISPTKMQRAPSEAMLRATLPAPPILVSLRSHGNDRRGRFRRNPRDLAIDEFVEHEIADAEHRLAGDRIRQGFKIEHCFSSSVARLAKTVGAIEKIADISRDGIFQRRETAIVAGALQPIDLALGEILVAAANLLGHVDILDIRQCAERGIGRQNQVRKLRAVPVPTLKMPLTSGVASSHIITAHHVVDIDEIAPLIAVGDAVAVRLEQLARRGRP